MEIRGILIQKLGESSGTSEKTGMPWRSAEFLVEIPGNYTRKINFKVRDGQYNLIKRFEELVGKEVNVSFEIDAHEHNGRWYNEVRAWGILEYRQEQKTAGEAVEETKKEDSFADINKGTDDLPF
jgi:nuclear transport factor 2 (NTF2) superfamily protein